MSNNNLLTNGSFEGGTWRKCFDGNVYAEIDVPEGWVAWWKHGMPVPHNPADLVGYAKPECGVIKREPPFLNPARIIEGNQGFKFFTFYRIHDGGLYQTVATKASSRYALTFKAHAWSAGGDDPRNSDDAPGSWAAIEGTPGLTDAQRNFTFRVGVDLTGGTDPFASTVQWGVGAHIYNVYKPVPTLEFTATGPQTTVFLRSSTLWPLKHCDAYMDDVVLVEVEAGPEPNPVDYTVVVELLPQDATLDEKVLVLQQTHMQRRTILQSADDAARLVAPGLPDSCVNVWAKDRWPGDIATYLHERGVHNINFFEFCTEIEPPVTPPINGPCTTRGTKLGIHTIAPSLVPEHTRLCALANAPVPVVKAVDDWAYLKTVKENSPTTLTIARKVMSFDGAREVQYMSLAMIREAARQYMQAYHDLLVQQGQYDNGKRLDYIDYLELLNEADPPGVEGYRNLALLMIEMLSIGEQWDLPVKKFACLGLNVGTPEWDELVAIADTGLFERIAAGGHILTLHEGAFPFSDHIDKWWDGVIPGSPCVERAGALCGRYRFWLHLARQRGVHLPIVISEFYSGPNYNITSGNEIVKRIAWYDNLVKDDPEVLAFLPFTNGPTAQWTQQNYDPFLGKFYEHTIATKDRVNVCNTVEPDILTIVDIRDQLPTNPESPWYPWQRRALSEITHVFVHHSAGAASSNVSTVTAINAYHTAVTGKNRPGICYTYVIGADGTIWYVSDIENVVFSQGSTTYPGDENRFGVGVCLLGSFIAGREPTGAQLDSLDKLIQRLCVLVGKDLHVWGHKDVASTQCPGDSWPFKPEWGRYNKTPVMVGFNDYPGDTGTAADWLEANGKQGLIVRPIFLGGAGSILDFSAQKHQKVIVNLRYSWSTDMGGSGTLPLPNTPEWQQFVDAAIYTINNSINVWSWEIGNEHNNPREFPVTGDLTPQAVAQTYNAIRAGCPGKRMSPGALDPFNAIAGDPRNWLEAVYNGITGVEFVTAHGYIRGPDANLVGSTAKFGDDPLRWQYLNYPGCITELLKALPQEYKSLPVYVTEFNHLWRTVEPDWGWVSDARAAAVVEAAIDAAATNGLSGVALYRWAGDEWALEHNDFVKDVL